MGWNQGGCNNDTRIWWIIRLKFTDRVSLKHVFQDEMVMSNNESAPEDKEIESIEQPLPFDFPGRGKELARCHCQCAWFGIARDSRAVNIIAVT